MTDVNCPICNSTRCRLFYCASDQPVNENILYSTQENAFNAPRGDIELVFCEDCSFVFNRAFESHQVKYDEQYKYTQPPSTYFETFIHQLAQDLIDSYDIRHKNIVEIGCGKGSFLRLLCRLGGNSGVGYDTSYEGPLKIEGEQVRFVHEYLCMQLLQPVPDLICCRQVIEHMSEPAELLNKIRHAVGNGSDTIVFFETPDLSWILQNIVPWDFYYEHCSYFTAESLSWLFESNGFRVLRSEKVFGDQYLRIDSRLAFSSSGRIPPEAVAGAEQMVNEFAVQAKRRLASIRSQSTNYSAEGPWAIWGGGAKGVTFCNLVLDVVGNALQVVDINPVRQGKFVPIAGNRVIPPEQLINVQPHTILIMNRNYSREIEKDIKDMGLAANLVCIDNLEW